MKHCKSCIFLDNGKVYGHFMTGKLIACLEFNYGEDKHHVIRYIGEYDKKAVKIMFPHARFVNFKDLGKRRIEKEKIEEMEMVNFGNKLKSFIEK